MKKLSIKADNCFIDNKDYGTYVNGKDLADIISKQLPKADGAYPAKINIEIEIFDKELKFSTEGYEVEKETVQESRDEVE